MPNEDSMIQTRLVPFLGALVVGVILIWAGIDSADIGALLASLTPVFVTEWMRRPQNGHPESATRPPNSRAREGQRPRD
ncbi:MULTISPECIES: hypothetical protein [Streptomyces]|uniref:hypothetical protein n=1 Tax=Streptomyces TaxID=1883 RepID=UPI0036F8EA83